MSSNAKTLSYRRYLAVQINWCCLVFLGTCSVYGLNGVVAASLQEKTAERPQPTKITTEERSLISQLVKGTFDSDYLLEELGVINDQRQVISHEIAKFRAEFANNQSNLLNAKNDLATGKHSDAAVLEKEFNDHARDVLSKIRDELTESQWKILPKVLRQRQQLETLGVEAFVLPILIADDLGLEGTAKSAFGQRLRELAADFDENKSKLFQDCMSSMGRELPDELRDKWREFIDLKKQVLELGNLAYSSALLRMPPNDLAQWRVGDFDNFEMKALNEIVFQLHVNKPFASKIDLTEGDMAEISTMLSQLMEAEQKDRPGIEKRQKMASLVSRGRTLEATRASWEYEFEVARYRGPTVTRILDEVLAREQAKALRSLAKTQRCYLESGCGDVFGLFFEFSTSRNVGSDIRARFESKLTAGRKEFYEMVNQKREEIEVQVKELLGADKWSAFVGQLGDFYNLEAERVLAWDKSRK